MAPVKLLMTWDLAPGRERDYFEFVTSEFEMGLRRLGVTLTDAWLTRYGKQPQFLVGVEAESYNKMLTVLNTSEWGSLRDRLAEFVTDFQWRVVRSSNRFQM